MSKRRKIGIENRITVIAKGVCDTSPLTANEKLSQRGHSKAFETK